MGFSQHWTSTAQKNEINQTSRRKKYFFSSTLFCCQTTCANVSRELLQTPVCRARQTCEGSRFNTNNALIPHVQCTAVQILVIYKSAVINVWQIRINLYKYKYNILYSKSIKPSFMSKSSFRELTLNSFWSLLFFCIFQEVEKQLLCNPDCRSRLDRLRRFPLLRPVWQP